MLLKFFSEFTFEIFFVEENIGLYEFNISASASPQLRLPNFVDTTCRHTDMGYTAKVLTWVTLQKCYFMLNHENIAGLISSGSFPLSFYVRNSGHLSNFSVLFTSQNLLCHFQIMLTLQTTRTWCWCQKRTWSLAAARSLWFPVLPTKCHFPAKKWEGKHVCTF